jgi:Flp pilus assembly protein TadG
MFKAIRTRLASRLSAVSRSVARRLLQREDGAAAIEFGLVAAPFLALTFAIVETALVFFAGQYLETVAADSSRLIMTGQAQTQGWSQSQFLTQVCAKVVALFSCNSLIADVQSYTAYSGTNTSLPLSDGHLTFPTDGQGKPITSYNPGVPGSIVVMRLMYQWPVWVWFPGLSALSNMSSKQRLLMATAAFSNEPYQ